MSFEGKGGFDGSKKLNGNRREWTAVIRERVIGEVSSKNSIAT